MSDAGEAPHLLARPECLVLTGQETAAGRTRVAVAVPESEGKVLGFSTVTAGPDGALELDDLFVDPQWQRRGAKACSRT